MSKKKAEDFPQEEINAVMKELEEIGDYDCVEYLGEWNGYDVFETGFENSEDIMYIGMPQLILYKDGKTEVFIDGYNPEYEEIQRLFSDNE